MATQPAPSYERMTQAPTAPNPVPRQIPRRVVPRPSVGPPAPKQAAQARERQRLLLQMLPLVKRLALSIRQHLPAHVEMDDLIGNGVLGLVDAVDKFDTTKRVKLESYARHRIRGGILDGLRIIDPASRDLRRMNRRIQQIYRELENKLGRPIADEEIAVALGLSLPEWHRALNNVQSAGCDFRVRTLSAGPTSRRPAPESAFLANDDANPVELCYRREQRELLGRALSSLCERDRQIMILYYEQELTMKQIADRLGIDESRVSQLHTAALLRLKSCVESMLRPRRAGLPKAIKSLAMAAGKAF